MIGLSGIQTPLQTTLAKVQTPLQTTMQSPLQTRTVALHTPPSDSPPAFVRSRAHILPGRRHGCAVAPLASAASR
jgi:hypothetical protein